MAVLMQCDEPYNGCVDKGNTEERLDLPGEFRGNGQCGWPGCFFKSQLKEIQRAGEEGSDGGNPGRQNGTY